MVSVSDVVEDFNAFAGIVLNSLLLLYAIRKFSRKTIGSYKYLLAIFAGFDVFLAVLHAAVKPRVIIIDGIFGIVSEQFEAQTIISIYVSSFTVPFALMIIHFLYRFWSIRHQNLIPLFKNVKFIGRFSLYPLAQFSSWYAVCLTIPIGYGPETGRTILRRESYRRLGKEIKNGWDIVNFWVPTSIPIRFRFRLTTDSNFKADKISAQGHNLQWKLFIAVCAQTFEPILFVYIPYSTVLNFGFFRLPVFHVDDAFKFLTSCFPVWDAVVILLLMNDYRDGLIGMFRKKNNTAIEMTIQSTSIVPSIVTQ